MSSAESGTQEMASLSQGSTRRDDVEFKQLVLARLLAETETEGILLLEPMNFRWFTSGALLRGTFGPDEMPGIYVNAQQRWLLCTSIDTQRFFDDELDGLGFQVKEWPWNGSRDQHLTDLCFARKVACDRPFRECKMIGPALEQERRRLTRYEETQLIFLGNTLAHALEATARNAEPGDSESELAGHLSHRLYKRGVEPTAVQVSADDRPRGNRRPGVTTERIAKRCLLQATATRAGLFATASRSFAFGAPDPDVRAEYDAAARLSALWLASLKAGDRPAALIDLEQQHYKDTPFEHEWRLAGPGWWTGHAPSEEAFTRNGLTRFEEGNAVVFRSQIGSCVVADTFVLRADGWFPVTAVEEWPVRRFVLQGVKFDRPDLLARNTGSGDSSSG